ncbi:MAG: LPP leucine zipper domain-containing protein [Succinivibrio sp.]
MNKFQATLAVVALGSSVLVGCANTSSLEAKLDAIAADVDALKAQQSKLANDVAFVKSDAARANERLDNLARRYKK